MDLEEIILSYINVLMNHIPLLLNHINAKFIKSNRLRIPIIEMVENNKHSKQ